MLGSLAPFLAENGEARRLLAEIRLANDDFEGAWAILRDLDAAEDLWVATAAFACASALGDGQRDQWRESLGRLSSLHFAPSAGQRATLLVVNAALSAPITDSAQELHYHSNFPGQIMQRLADHFRFVSVLADSQTARAQASLLKPDLILNNVVNGEVLLGGAGDLQGTVAEFVDSLAAPIVNHPRRAALSTRQRLFAALADLPGVRAPRTVRFIGNVAERQAQAAWWEQSFGYPLILRTTFAQRGVGMVRIDRRDQLLAALDARNGAELYAHECVEARHASGLYRKIRAAFVGDDIIPVRVDFDVNWMVHGRLAPERKAFYRANPSLLAAEAELLNLPNSALTESALATLRAMRRRIPLDIFGMDFDILPDGRILFFEANASMLLLDYLTDADADLRHPVTADRKLEAAFQAYLQSLLA